MLQIGHKSKNWQWHHNFLAWCHRHFFNVAVFPLSNLVSGPSFISMSLLVLELWQFSFIRDWPEIRKSEIPPSAFYPNWDKLGKPNLSRMSLIECYWMLQNARVTAFTVSELLRENQHGGLNYPPPRFGLRSIFQSCCNDVPKFGISAAIMLSGRYLP